MTRFSRPPRLRLRHCLAFAFIAALPAQGLAAERFEVRASNLSVRSCPSTDCGRLRLLPEGTEVTVLETEGGWARIGDYTDARCVDGRSRRIQTGTATCDASNGVTDGQMAEWVAARYLAPLPDQDADAPAEQAPPAEPDQAEDAPEAAASGPDDGTADAPSVAEEPVEAAPEKDPAGDGTDRAALAQEPVPQLPDGIPGAERWSACLVDYTLLRRHLMAMRDLGLPIGSAEVNLAAERAAALAALAPAMAAVAPGAVPDRLPPRREQDALSASVVREGLDAARAGLEKRTRLCDIDFALLW